MRVWLLLAITLASSGCVGQDRPAPVVCDPLSIVTEEDHTIVTATFRNCTSGEQVVSTQWCNAPWTPVTVRVVSSDPGRFPRNWGVLAGDGASRAPQDRFIERCPETFERVEPDGRIEAVIPWNGTFFEDRCAPRDGAPSNFTCPTWVELDPGFYALEAIVWPIEGDPWMESVRVRRENATQTV